MRGINGLFWSSLVIQLDITNQSLGNKRIVQNHYATSNVCILKYPIIMQFIAYSNEAHLICVILLVF